MQKNLSKNKLGRTIFVTGGVGFIGSNYLNKFVPTYPSTLFVNIDNLTYAGNFDNIAISKNKNYRFENVDIRNKSQSSSTEKSPLKPSNPYSATKTSAENIVYSYFKTFVTNIVITRSSNNYGPNQDKTKLIPSFISRLLDNRNVPLYSKGQNIRDWLYVEDNIDAINLVFDKGKSGEIYNIGANKEKTNIEVTKSLLKMASKDQSMIEFVTDRPGHDFRYSLNISKIKKDLGWKPRVKFSDGLARTFNFYKNILKK